MKYGKGFVILLIATLVTACSMVPRQPEITKKEGPIKLLAPMGAPSLSILGLYGENKVSIDTVNGSDMLIAQLSKSDGEYDAIVAPINMGANLLSKGKSHYLLDRVVTWGNLYIVGKNEESLNQKGMFAAFGEQSVPQKVLTSSINLKGMTPEITYFNSPNDVQAQLLTEKATIGLLAEPAATATIASAAKKGLELKILTDLQLAYKESTNSESIGYPQAALFVKKGSEAKIASYLTIAENFANDIALKDAEAIVKAVDIATPAKLGIPNAQIAKSTWKRQNIKFIRANTVKKDIDTFLKQFSINLAEDKYTKE